MLKVEVLFLSNFFQDKFWYKIGWYPIVMTQYPNWRYYIIWLSVGRTSWLKVHCSHPFAQRTSHPLNWQNHYWFWCLAQLKLPTIKCQLNDAWPTDFHPNDGVSVPVKLESNWNMPYGIKTPNIHNTLVKPDKTLLCWCKRHDIISQF